MLDLEYILKVGDLLDMPETNDKSAPCSSRCYPRNPEHAKGIEWASLALQLMAEDNGMARTPKRPDIDETLAKQACRIGDDMEDFVQGDCCKATKLAVMRCAVDFHDWLNRCFDGDLSHEYFCG